MVVIRGIFLKGVGITALWEQLLGLVLIGSTLLSLAIVRFRKTNG
jgi:ABC-2 type transport system permease protein